MPYPLSHPRPAQHLTHEVTLDDCLKQLANTKPMTDTPFNATQAQTC